MACRKRREVMAIGIRAMVKPAAAAIVALCGLALFLAPPGEAQSEPPSIKIGAILPLTYDPWPPIGLLGENILDGLELWVHEVNDLGGLDGRVIELDVRDSQLNPALAAAHAEELADAGAVAVIGPLTSSSLGACMPVSDARGLVMLSGSSTSPALALPDLVFRTIPDDLLQGVAAAKYVRESLSADEALVVAMRDPYGLGLQHVFFWEFKARGGTPHQAHFSQNLTDERLDELIEEMKQTLGTMGPNPVVMLIGFESQVFRVGGRTLTEPEMSDIRWLLTDAIDATVWALLPDNEGDAGTRPFLDEGSPAFQAFEDAYLATGHGSVGSFVPQFYDAIAVLTFALARQQQRGEALGGAALAAALVEVGNQPGDSYMPHEWADAHAALLAGEDVDFEGAFGPADFDDNGEVKGHIEVWKIEGGSVVSDVVFAPEELERLGKK
jgi:branched-chain amino acid transport system substrate-binding protein